MTISKTITALVLLALALVSHADIADDIGATIHETQELALMDALNDFRNGDIQGALSKVEPIVEAEPNYKLAHLIHGDLLAAQAGVPLSVDLSTSLIRDSVDPIFAEARQRWRHFNSDVANKLPSLILKLADFHNYAMLVDVSKSRLFVFRHRDGELSLISDHYVSAGKNGAGKQRQGDQKTPLGVYTVVDRLPGQELPDRYGPVAFPVNYPNYWDRSQSRTGGGIWLHGVASDTYARPPLASDGCIAMPNSELETLSPLIEVGRTPVVIADVTTWADPAAIDSMRNEIVMAIDTWIADWESLDPEAYLANYATDFEGRGMNKSQWSTYKRRVNKNKKYIDVEIDNLTILGYPAENEMVVATFRQEYTSDNYNSSSAKQLYLQKDDAGQWRIRHEGLPD